MSDKDKEEKPSQTSEPQTLHKRAWWGSPKKILLRVIILSLLCMGAAKILGTYGAYQLVTDYITIDAGALSEAAPLRIAFIADIHSDGKILERAVEEIKRHQPDIIIIGGDIVDASLRFSRSRDFIIQFKQLAAIAPTYVILGNHDMERLDETTRVIEKSEITLLHNKAITWTSPSGKQIRLIGLGDWNEYEEDPQACMKAVGEEELPVILLSHDPESRWLLTQYDWDLMLSGHTHGGQARNPLTGDYISFRSSMPAGLFSFEGNRQIYVTRGLGSIYGMRFFCPAEVSIIDIK
ncbi:MAG: metallophosphoesterase [Akkermansia sp.]